MVRQTGDTVDSDFRVPVREMLKLKVPVDTDTHTLFFGISVYSPAGDVAPVLPLRDGSLPESY